MRSYCPVRFFFRIPATVSCLQYNGKPLQNGFLPDGSCQAGQNNGSPVSRPARLTEPCFVMQSKGNRTAQGPFIPGTKITAGSSPNGEEPAVVPGKGVQGAGGLLPKIAGAAPFPGKADVTGRWSGGGPGPSGGPRRRARRFQPGGRRPGRPGCRRHRGDCPA